MLPHPPTIARPLIAILALASAAFTTVLIAQTPSRSVKEGVYTGAQATRGRALYEEKCSNCHAARMWGQDWPEKSVFDVYDVVKNFMPENDPGSLSGAQTRDIVAYILQTNKLPAGTKELPEGDDDMKGIRLELP